MAAGGFTPLAYPRVVRIRHADTTGHVTSTTVDLSSDKPSSCRVAAGVTVFVPERMF